MWGLSRREFLKSLGPSGALFYGCSTGTKEAREQGAVPYGKKFMIRGVYFHDGFDVERKNHAPLYWDVEAWRRELDWLDVCGINAVEFATMLEFTRIPTTDLERTKIQDRLKVMELAHAKGMQFGYILTTTAVSTVPEDEEPGHQLKNRAAVLCPQERGNFEKTVGIQNWYLQTYRDADFFEVFAGDWGGCTCGRCGVSDYLRYVNALAEESASFDPKKPVFANTWAIGYWGADPLRDGWRGFFDSEIVKSREVLDRLGTLPGNVQVTLPCHHYYRPLTFSEYGGMSHTPLFPTREDVRTVQRSGRRLMAWPHFVMDDDVYRPAAWALVHVEARYLRALISRLSEAGIQEVMGNLYTPFIQLANTYAFGAFLRDPNLTAERVLQEFAAALVFRDDREALADVLAWMDNHSYWQEQLPEDARLPLFDVAMTKERAQRVVRDLRFLRSPALPIPITGEDYQELLAASLERMTWAS